MSGPIGFVVMESGRPFNPPWVCAACVDAVEDPPVLKESPAHCPCVICGRVPP